MDTVMLINAVRIRHLLWDNTIGIYDRKLHSNELWMEVANILNVTEKSARRRWRSVRDKYRNEIRKIQQNVVTESKWAHFSNMEFMRHIFDPKGLVPFPPHTLESETYDAFQIINRTTDLPGQRNEGVITLDDNDADPAIIIIGDKNSNQTEIEASEDSANPSSKRRRTSYQEESSSLQFLPTPPPSEENCLITSPNNETSLPVSKAYSDLIFLVYMLSHMQSLSYVSNLQFRMEAIRILFQIKQNDGKQ